MEASLYLEGQMQLLAWWPLDWQTTEGGSAAMPELAELPTLLAPSDVHHPAAPQGLPPVLATTSSWQQMQDARPCLSSAGCNNNVEQIALEGYILCT